MADNLIKQNYMFLAKTAEQAEMFKDMYDYVEKFVHVDPTLSPEERLVFCSASKNVIQTLRNSYIAVNEDEISEKLHLAKENYKATIAAEISDFCERVAKILEKQLIPSAGEDKESMLKYLTMKGDFYRYMAEVKHGDKRDAAMERAEHTYVAAMEIAQENFKPINSSRLAVFLNFSVFCFDILGDENRGIRILKSAFDEACFGSHVDHADDRKKENHKDSFIIMGVMQKNLFQWQTPNFHLARINHKD